MSNTSTAPAGRLHAAFVILMIRGLWAGGTGAVFTGLATIIWLTRPAVDPNDSSSVVGAVLYFLLAGGLAVVGLVGLAFGIPSLVYAALVRKGTRLAVALALWGDIALIAAAIALFAWSLGNNDAVPAGMLVAVVLLTAAPVVALLTRQLMRA